jgi:hypothetical protein
MQMGRWFGYRSGYEDLTRIYTTPLLAGWFADLALVEYRLREDIKAYEYRGLTPAELGIRILQHPTMQVTSRVKQRFARSTTIAQTYSLSIAQTFKFPLSSPQQLAISADRNLLAVRELVGYLPRVASANSQPTWTGIPARTVLNFLSMYSATSDSGLSLPLIIGYIERVLEKGELATWTISICGRGNKHPALGTVDLGSGLSPINQISRSRLGATDSLGIISEQEDEAISLTDDNRKAAQDQIALASAAGEKLSPRVAWRMQRDPTNGLLLIYPISRKSGLDKKPDGSRRPLYADPNGPLSRDLIGLAISFPRTADPPLTVEAYLEGTAGWRLVD